MPSDEATAKDAAEEQKEESVEEKKEPTSAKKKEPAAEKPAEEEEKAPKKRAAATAKKETKSFSKDDIVAAIKEMTVLELSELVKTLEETFGVSAAAPVVAAGIASPTAQAAAAGVAPGIEAGAEGEEQTEFNVILKDIGANKISVIKAVREVTTLGLKEAKELVESAPKPIKEGVNKAEAATLKEKIEAAGATVEVQ